MGPRPPRAPVAPAKRLPGPAPARAVVVERRALADRPRLRPKPDAAAQLREVATTMQHLPRDCIRDPAELVTLMRRLAGRLIVIADTGLDVVRGQATQQPRQPFLRGPRADPKAGAETVFGTASGRSRGDQVGSVTSRKGRTVAVEVRRRRLAEAGQYEMIV